MCERTLKGHEIFERNLCGMSCVTILPNGRVVSGSLDKTLRVWDATSGACERVVESTDADFDSLKPSGRGSHSLLALGHSGPLLATSSTRIHASEILTVSIAAGSIADPVLVGGAQSGKIFFMTVVAAR